MPERAELSNLLVFRTLVVKKMPKNPVHFAIFSCILQFHFCHRKVTRVFFSFITLAGKLPFA